MLDLRWWGAVLPAQIFVLGALPVAGTIGGGNAAAQRRWQAVQALGGIAATALAASLRLAAVAAATVGWVLVVALATLWSSRRQPNAGWRAAPVPAIRACAGAMAAGFLLVKLADPVGLILPAMPALCLLIATGWLLYLVIRGEPIGAAHPLPAALTAPVADG